MEGDNVIIIHAHIGKVKNFRSIVKSCFYRKAKVKRSFWHSK